MTSFFSCCLEPEIFETFIKKCEDPHCCCGCCSALRPRYKRLVDSIFPVNPQDGLVRNNMEKLTFYALSSPEKLDRIGEYLAQRVSRDINRHRIGFVIIAMEALDQLLVACHAPTLNLFVESYLKMVQKLLEFQEPELQILATQSFVKFANIEEDTPSYHRRYDFFVSKFSSMCHSSLDDVDTQERIRLAGLRGLQGVVRKTVRDELQVNIFAQTHMDKIVPSLLFNMKLDSEEKIEPDVVVDSPEEEETSANLAESCLRELSGRAAYGNIKSVLGPVLKHLDNHKLWVPNDFAVHIFKVVMFSIQSQYLFTVIQTLMGHLDEHVKDSPRIRTAIMNVLANIVIIATGDPVGPSVLEIVNSLLAHLRMSVDQKISDPNAMVLERQFQETVIQTLGEFVRNLPDYQKIEIMMFILGKVPAPDREEPCGETGVLLQNMLLKSLLKVGTKYEPVNMLMTFPVSFLDPLLRVSLSPDPDVRLVVQQIFHTLLDRHGNKEKFQKPGLQDEFEVSAAKFSRPDVTFMKKNGTEILLHLHLGLQFTNNTQENYDAISCTLSLLLLEVGSEEVLVDQLRAGLAVQDLAVTNVILSDAQKFYIHVLTSSYFNLISHLTSISALSQHIRQVIQARRANAGYLLPDYQEIVPENISAESIPANLLFSAAAIEEALKDSGLDTSKLQAPLVPRHSSADPAINVPSSSDIHSISVEVDSCSSSPGIQRKHPQEEITVESLKKMLQEPAEVQKQAEEVRRLQILETFKTLAFEDLVAKTESKTDTLQNKLNEIFGRITPAGVLTEVGTRSPGSPHPTAKMDEIHRHGNALPISEIQFPELFVF